MPVNTPVIKKKDANKWLNETGEHYHAEHGFTPLLWW